MTTIADLIPLIEAQGKSFEDFQKGYAHRLDNLEKFIKGQEIDRNRRSLPAPGTSPEDLIPTGVELFTDSKSGAVVPVLEAGTRLADLEKTESKSSVGRLLRGIVLGGAAKDAGNLADERKEMGIGADPSGGYTVSGRLAAEWIDLLRAQMVLNRAGVRTVPMDAATLTLAKVTGDPAVHWHTENASVANSEATLGAVKLTAKTAVCLVKFSLELAQDSLNIEQVLQATITRALAQAIDQAGISGVAENAAAAPSGIINLEGRNSVTSIGAPTSWDFLIDGMGELLVDNVPMDRIGAMVAHPSVWKKMAKLKTGITNDKTPLPAPDEVSKIPKLWTTAAPLVGGNATGIIADWRDLLFGVRKDITIRVLSETFMGTNLQLAVLAYARVDFQATRADSFCTLEGITV